MSDIHYAELARDLKQNNGFVNWHIVANWYNKHYVYVSVDNAHRYINDIMYVITNYVTRNNLITVHELVSLLTPRFEAYTQKFYDLSDDYNSKLNYKILAAICGKLVLTEVSKIPSYNELP